MITTTPAVAMDKDHAQEKPTEPSEASSSTQIEDDEEYIDERPDFAPNGRPIFKKRDYDSIPVQDRGAIRILKVQCGPPEQQEVRCELVQGTIIRDQDRDHDRLPDEECKVDFEPYDALSWCWGKEPSDACISILKDETSYVMYVQPGLAAALRALRHNIHTRYLWV